MRYWTALIVMASAVAALLVGFAPGAARPAPYGQATIGGMEDRIDSMLPPVFRPNIVPRS